VTLAAASGTTLWYLARGTGLVSIVLLTIVVVMGIAQIERFATEGWPRFVIAGLHKNLSLLVVVFLGVHIASSVIDAFAPIPWIAAVVPFASSYRPLWLSMGALAFDLLIALVVTSLLRVRLGLRAWRAVHWLAYVCWPIAFVHGLGTGSDGRVGWVQVLDLVCLALVGASVAWRLAAGWERDPARRAAGALVGVVVILAVIGWSVTGPTQPGWSRKAGTPESVLAKLSGGSTTPAEVDLGATPGSSDPQTAAPAWSVPFTADFSGSVATTTSSSTSTVTIDGTLANGADGHLHIVISGPTAAGGGIRMQSSSVTIGPTSQPTEYTGTVTGLSGSQIRAVVKSASGDTISLTVQVQLDEAAGKASGTVAARQGTG
jgi:sulfoxide reductase heme-binding subunit YedZ